MAYTEDDLKKELETKEYEYGFYTDIESETFPVGLNEDIVRAISAKKNGSHIHPTDAEKGCMDFQVFIVRFTPMIFVYAYVAIENYSGYSGAK